MAKAWADHSQPEKMAVYEGLAKIYAEAGHPAGLKPPGSSSEFVNVLMVK